MRTKAFKYLWLGQFFANYGDIFYIIAILTTVNALTGSLQQMAFVVFIITFSKYTGSILAPVLVIRYPFKHLLAGSQTLKTILFAAQTVAAGQTFSMPVILVLAALIAFLDGWSLPVSNSMIPSLANREELLKTNGLLSSLAQITQLSGWAIGGVLTAVIQPAGMFRAAAFLSLCAALLMYGLPKHARAQARKRSLRSYTKSLGAGWLAIWKKKSLRLAHLVYLTESIANVVWIAAVLLFFTEQKLHAGEIWWGLINSSFFAGLILAGILLFRMHGFFATKRPAALLICCLLAALSTFLFGISSNKTAVLILSLLYGCFDQLKKVILNTVIQTETDFRALPDVYAAQGVLVLIAFGLATLAAGWFGEHFGATAVFMASALLLLVNLFPIYKIGKHL
ncbi:MFS transporter [Heyndrickxia acidiproducens]|uniref:MFS transporter n=1 Tax=Heyndrickxia acidiproducens TaxID=1121084 RepID=UPI0003800CB6|nr:MFS transporter [Heyndrickxia acidiproducens]